MVTSQKILVIEMGNRGSKSDNLSVKEQRVDGSSIREPDFVGAKLMVRCTLVAGKAGSWKKLSNSRLKIPQ